MNFDFDEWAKLYEVDPDAFEVKRTATLERLLESADQESRLALEQTLFRANMVRRRAKSPLQAALEASNLMWESFGKLREKVNELEDMVEPAAQSPIRTNSLRLISGQEVNNTDSDPTFELKFEKDQLEESASTLPPEPQGQTASIIRFPGTGRSQ